MFEGYVDNAPFTTISFGISGLYGGGDGMGKFVINDILSGLF